MVKNLWKIHLSVFFFDSVKNKTNGIADFCWVQRFHSFSLRTVGWAECELSEPNNWAWVRLGRCLSHQLTAQLWVVKIRRITKCIYFRTLFVEIFLHADNVYVLMISKDGNTHEKRIWLSSYYATVFLRGKPFKISIEKYYTFDDLIFRLFVFEKLTISLEGDASPLDPLEQFWPMLNKVWNMRDNDKTYIFVKTW